MAYKKCPRCELNWIKQEEEYCDVCKTELKIQGGINLIPEDDEFEGEKLCPICKTNFLMDDEKICSSCKAEQLHAKVALVKDEIVPDVIDTVEDDESWRDFIEEEAVDVLSDDETEISLAELVDEEEELVDDEEDVSIDDFEPLNIDDFEDDDLEEDDEDELDDEDDIDV